jgi:hypothetical protein
MGPIGCSETSAQNYHSTPRNTPEECRSHLHRGGSLKSRNLGTKHKLVLNFTFRLFLTPRRIPCQSFYKPLGGPIICCECCREEKKICDCQQLNSNCIVRPTRSLITILTDLNWLVSRMKQMRICKEHTVPGRGLNCLILLVKEEPIQYFCLFNDN